VADTQPPDSLPFSERPLPPHFRWNFICMFLESTLFVVGMGLVNITTVLPPLIQRLSGSTVVVGLATGLFNGVWLLPQVFVAGAVSGMARKKPLIVAAIWSSRVPFLVAGLVLWRVGMDSPAVSLATVLICVSLFYAIDAVAAVPWFDLVPKCIPANRRGRLFGMSEVLGGLGGIGTGFLVRYALGASSPWSFPTNYAVLFLGAGAVFQAGSLIFSFVREPASEVAPQHRPSTRQVLRQMPGILSGDRAFRRLILVRLSSGFVGVASAFYVLHATQRMGLGAESTGYFVSAQVVGALAAGLLTSVVQDRFGPLTHIRVMGALAALPASIALLIEPLSHALGGQIVALYLLLFFVLGLFSGSSMWPFFNWAMEYAPEEKRPSYMGLLNTLGGLNMLAPALGGWIVKAVSYQAAFALALGFAGLTLVLARALPSTRRTSQT
jgi:MFS family permease